MTGEGRTDPPTPADRDRLRRAHARVHAIDEARSAALRTTFRDEIGAVVRSVSPFLISLLAAEGMTVDEVAMCLESQSGWPRRPRLSRRGVPGPKSHTHVMRYYYAGLLAHGLSLPPLHGYRIDCADRGWIRVEVVDHSLEVSGKMGVVRFETRFGELRIELIDEMPQTVFITCKGRLVDDVVDHVALRGRGWRIDEIEDATARVRGQALVVVTGSTAYRLPWARRERRLKTVR